MDPMRSNATQRPQLCNLRLAIGNLQPAMPALALLALLLAPDTLWAADATFPRGPGFYFNPFKLVVLLLVYLCWIRTCWWVDTDAKKLKLARDVWNGLLIGCALGGVLILWLLPWFWLSSVV